MKKLILLLAFLLTTIASFAGPANMVFVGFSPTWEEGYPYFATVNGGPVTNVMCDDWFHGGYAGQQWMANVTDLGSGNLSLLRFNGSTDALKLYFKAGWLLLQDKGKSLTDRKAINYAVWWTFDHNTDLNQAPGALAWLAAADTEAGLGFPGVDFGQIVIYTPLSRYDPDPNGPQELLTIVPEPATLILLAGGALGVWGRRKLT